MTDASPPLAGPPPLVAAAVSLVAPPALFYTTGQVFFLPVPLGFGAGHLLAGDWRRAAAVSAGGLGAMGAGALLGVGANYLLLANDPRPRVWANPLVGTFLAMGAYSAWSAWDAYQTALRRHGDLEPAIATP